MLPSISSLIFLMELRGMFIQTKTQFKYMPSITKTQNRTAAKFETLFQKISEISMPSWARAHKVGKRSADYDSTLHLKWVKMAAKVTVSKFAGQQRKVDNFLLFFSSHVSDHSKDNSEDFNFWCPNGQHNAAKHSSCPQGLFLLVWAASSFEWFLVCGWVFS